MDPIIGGILIAGLIGCWVNLRLSWRRQAKANSAGALCAHGKPRWKNCEKCLLSEDWTRDLEKAKPEAKPDPLIVQRAQLDAQREIYATRAAMEMGRAMGEQKLRRRLDCVHEFQQNLTLEFQCVKCGWVKAGY